MITARTIFATFALACLAAPFAGAQRPQGGGPPPEMRAKMKAWETWRAKHKNVTAIEQTLAGLDMMERDTKTRLTKAQAKKILPVLKAWRTKPVMTDAQARAVNKQITAPLTVAQLKKIAAAPASGQRGSGGSGGRGGRGGPGMGGPPPGGTGGRPPGGPPRDGKRPAMPSPKEYNPLNPNTLPFEQMRPMAKQRLDGLIKTLAQRAK